jgi:hypothetical protein
MVARWLSREASYESVINVSGIGCLLGITMGVPPTERYALIALLHHALTAEEVHHFVVIRSLIAGKAGWQET